MRSTVTSIVPSVLQAELELTQSKVSEHELALKTATLELKEEQNQREVAKAQLEKLQQKLESEIKTKDQLFKHAEEEHKAAGGERGCS